MKYAIVDLGSNTVRLSVYHALDGGKFETLFSEKEMAGLAGYIVDGAMSPDGINKACAVLMDFQAVLRQLGMEQMHVFATAPLRNIQNTDEVLQAIHRRTGIDVDVVSGSEEGRLGYYGALYSTAFSHGMLFDIGGGSTEIVAIENGNVTQSQSVPMGSLNLFHRFVTKIWPKKSELEEIREEIARILSSIQAPGKKGDRVCCVGGTARAVLKIANSRFQSDPENRILTRRDLDQTVKLLTEKSKETRDLILKTCPDRIHTIIPGALLMQGVFETLRCKDGIVSGYGVREGYLCKNFLKATI